MATNYVRPFPKNVDPFAPLFFVLKKQRQEQEAWKTTVKNGLFAGALATAIVLAATVAQSADLYSIEQARDGSTTECMACLTDPSADHRIIQVNERIDRLQGGQNALDQNQTAINREIIDERERAQDALNGLVEDASNEVAAINARIDAEVEAGAQRMDQIEINLNRLTDVSPLAETSQAVQGNSNRIDGLEKDVKKLETDAAGWASMAAAINVPHVERGEKMALDLGLASVGGGKAVAVTAAGRITRHLSVNASLAGTDAGGAGGRVGVRWGF